MYILNIRPGVLVLRAIVIHMSACYNIGIHDTQGAKPLAKDLGIGRRPMTVLRHVRESVHVMTQASDWFVSYTEIIGRLTQEKKISADNRRFPKGKDPWHG